MLARKSSCFHIIAKNKANLVCPSAAKSLFDWGFCSEMGSAHSLKGSAEAGPGILNSPHPQGGSQGSGHHDNPATDT